MSPVGYTLQPRSATHMPGPRRPVPFVIVGPDDATVTAFDLHHDKKLHLIAARLDASGYQHVHPVLAEDGTWHAELDLSPGSWRMFADIKPTGEDVATLSADLIVPGVPGPRGPQNPTRVSEIDGYTASLTGDLVSGQHSHIVVTLTQDELPVTDLQPYLGAYGHLVVLRADDLAYLHVHPQGSPEDGDTASGPDVAFHAGVEADGLYHLFFDFQHNGVVRTAKFRITTA